MDNTKPDYDRAQREAEKLAGRMSAQQLAALAAALVDKLDWEASGRFDELTDCHYELIRAAGSSESRKI